MKNNPHGYCLILNNHLFRNPLHNREGTLEDGGKYFFNPITGLFGFFFSDNSPKQLSNLCCEEWYSLASETGMTVNVPIGNLPLPTFSYGLKKDLLFILGKMHCLNWLCVQLVKK